MCQGVKDGEKPGTSKADRKQPGKQKGNRKEVSFWRAGENVLETSEINSSVPLRTRQMRAEKGTAPLGNVVPQTEVFLSRKAALGSGENGRGKGCRRIWVLMGMASRGRSGFRGLQAAESPQRAHREGVCRGTVTQE